MEPYENEEYTSGSGEQSREFYKLQRARKRVQQIKGFYVHLSVYLVINLFIAGSILIQSNWHVQGAGLWGVLSTPVFWGIGLAFHAINVFGLNGILGREWEARQIRKYMEEDQREAEKFK
ncbi:2TM domain-containing protein [Robiginitalea sp. M366]|uniref:2TM domain-containing protein n=1 Tax=Robiginitalea aestuariiviva TaxID=3036903 RepID=UPI00240DF474|nr:2TM domain-containing protein [Robiginitalea aestuariiviva]MDG1573413.1 2TM domain-containing protein [Robiginitalea aestuariiviva]